MASVSTPTTGRRPRRLRKFGEDQSEEGPKEETADGRPRDFDVGHSPSPLPPSAVSPVLIASDDDDNCGDDNNNTCAESNKISESSPSPSPPMPLLVAAASDPSSFHSSSDGLSDGMSGGAESSVSSSEVAEDSPDNDSKPSSGGTT